MSYNPPYTITPLILKLVAEISEIIGRLTAQKNSPNEVMLRRANRIRTIHASLAIEGNTLSEDQITAILDGKRVIAPPKDVLEVKNALATYEYLASWLPTHEPHILHAHSILMAGLLNDAGHYRQGSVGVMSGTQVVHMAPGANQVPRLMSDLFLWLKHSDAPALIKSCIFHYEFEFIHPFSDGNGRMGRLWQTLILSQWQPVFTDIPVESLIYQHQESYYRALRASTAKSDSAPFIEFMLTIIAQTLQEVHPPTPVILSQPQPDMMAKTPQQVLALLSQKPALTIAELAKILDKSTSTIERAIAQLKQQQKLIYHGPKKGGQWQVLTD